MAQIGRVSSLAHCILRLPLVRSDPSTVSLHVLIFQIALVVRSTKPMKFTDSSQSHLRLRAYDL
jgi:hypothetical protein